MRRATATGLIICATALLGVCPAARSQSFSDSLTYVLIGDATLAPDGLTQLPVSVSGNVYARYNGTPEAGCAAHGMCGISGTLVWEPGRDGQIQVERLRIHGRVKLLGDLGFSNSSVVANSRRVSGSGPVGLCGDVGSDVFGTGLAGLRLGNSISVGLAGMAAGFATTHCPGPLDSDLVRLLPVRPLRHSIIRHGGGTMDLSTIRPFRSGGFAGVLHSTVRLRFGKPRKPRIPDFSDFKTPRLRYATARYRIDRISGTVNVSFAGLGDPDLCRPLDACGVTGTVSQALARGSGTLDVSALAPASRPKRELLHALGVPVRGRAGRLPASGRGIWKEPSGTLESDLKRPDGSAACTDTVPSKRGFLYATITGRGMRLEYASDAFRTRCGGPLESDLANNHGLAFGSVPFSALRHQHVTVHLTSGTRLLASGYSGATNPDLTVTLTRISVVSRLAPNL